MVKEALDGVGRWIASTSADTRSLGARPRDCRSDLQMLNFVEDMGRSYSGPEAGLPTTTRAVVKVDVYRYATVAAARKAVTRNATYPGRCPKVTEWVCTACDGIWTTWRTAVSAPTVGQQSVAWSFRQVGITKSNGYAVVARKNSVVVRVSVGRANNPEIWVYPEMIEQDTAVSLARIALRTAAQE